ncbi:MAG: hypothetical protein AVDCRST_MAG50-1105 [uncultured Acidimicrobiales bacterium]|uniref:YbjN domain-containing protein n=1 Tax=uncultured Acidimicrobiales bacterium TaxID=310071 RepID=A0A6J4HSM8_9ACTN|nr:MAG: hypothetical protein AVDCRST_MAG50-1105 [uncultured Acidimicrobiales bacterium]
MGDDERAALAELITRWANSEHETQEVVLAVDQLPVSKFSDAGPQHRWFIRIRGDEKAVSTIWLTLREQTLHYETQFMPSPEENREQLFEYLLRLNNRLFAMRFAIGDEEAIYLVGQLPLAALDEEELDRIVGSTYAYVEQWFRPAMRIGYESKFKG